MKYLFSILGLLLLCSVTVTAQYSATTACTTSGIDWTIYGYGAATTGGCQSGRTHLVVDTLTDVVDSTATSAAALLSNKGADGKISFREAIYGGSASHSGAAGARLVTFSVSGNISLTAGYEISNLDGPGTYSNLTIDGGDAPNGGVQIIQSPYFYLGFPNTIIRYMKFRAAESATDDSLSLYRSVSNIVVDHCSIQFGQDGDLDITNGLSDFTVQFSLFGNNFGSGSMLVKYNGTTRGTLFKNLFVQPGGRAPKWEEGTGQIVNNVVYRANNSSMPGYGVSTIGVNTDNPTPTPVLVDVIKNYYKMGPGETMGGGGATTLQVWDTPDSGLLSVYLFGNIGPERPTDTGDEWLLARDYVANDQRFSPIGGAPTLPTVSATQAYTDVTTGDTGSSQPCRDSLDTSLINDTINGASRHHPSTVAAAGGYPDLTQPCPSSSPARRFGGPVKFRGKIG